MEAEEDGDTVMEEVDIYDPAAHEKELDEKYYHFIHPSQLPHSQ